MSQSEELNEIKLATKEEAIKLAEKYKSGPNATAQTKALKDIPYSLLSAEHIKLVVEKTGLIYPFFTSNHRKSRLKKAAYEGRIGDKAYIYDKDNTLKLIFERENDEFLKVPKNQIVFVESDLDFRLPEFIALRFNLQIQHVHRGLLLGTGPLIDPGYWGKLCIPLHNLTDEDYCIPKDEGLIWLEFTKTTSSPNRSKNPIGRPPLGGEFWEDITKFLNKASKQYGLTPVPIRSALPTMFEQSKSSALSAEKAAKTTRNWSIGGLIVAMIAGLGLIISIFSLTAQFKSDTNKMFNEIEPKIRGNNDRIERHLELLYGKDDLSESHAKTIQLIEDTLQSNKTLEDKVEFQQNKIEMQKHQLEKLQIEVEKLKLRKSQGNLN